MRKRWIEMLGFVGLVLLVTFLLWQRFVPLPTMGARIGDLKFSYRDDWNLYCIDGSSYTENGILGVDDIYAYHLPSSQLSDREMAYLFWSLLSLQAATENNSDLKRIVQVYNTQAVANGKKTIKPYVTKEDLKGILHSSHTRSKYPWLEEIVDDEIAALTCAGLLGNKTVGGGEIPEILTTHTKLQHPYVVPKDSYELKFDQTGKDELFIQQSQLEFSLDGINWSVTMPGNGSYEKTNTSIQFFGDASQSLLLRFRLQGSAFELLNLGYSTKEEMYDNVLQLWIPTLCSGNHKKLEGIYGGSTIPLHLHQRHAVLELKKEDTYFYAVIGSVQNQLNPLHQEFEIFQQEEELVATYNLQLNKYDYETGQPLEGGIFHLYERFDDKEEIQEEKDGYAHIFIGGKGYSSYHLDSPVIWDDFRFVSAIYTDINGYGSKRIQREYHYEKTFCNGHPAPSFQTVPNKVYDVDEEGNETWVNEDEIRYAKDENRKNANQWIELSNQCSAMEHAKEGVHFHWIAPGVIVDQIQSIAQNGGEEGEKPNGGTTGAITRDEAFENSGCKNDLEETYDKFISLRYSYALIEEKAREGYIRHGIHSEDLPIEVITTDASENGANSYFAGIYSKDIIINENANATDTNPFRKSSVSGASESNIHTMSNLDVIELASRSNEEMYLATTSQIDLLSGWGGTMDRNERVITNTKVSSKFQEIYEESNYQVNETSFIVANSPDGFSHSNQKEQIKNRFVIYDHRAEGQIDINKRDIKLQREGYNSYGKSQGDGTLSGAVYGLFAKYDLVHPDGNTGVIYQKDNLISIATTDRNGDAKFTNITQPPGYYYQWDSGTIAMTPDGWATNAPVNLYMKQEIIDDYQEDAQVVRVYEDNEKNNGNCWIGQPLFLGEYYVRELSRSEGYERWEVEHFPEEDQGFALSITKQLTEATQIGKHPTGLYGDPDYNELFFNIGGSCNKSSFDIALYDLPQQAKLYQLEVSTEVETTLVGTGIYEKQLQEDIFGNPKYITVTSENQYPVFLEDGSMMKREVPTPYYIELIPKVEGKGLEEPLIVGALESAESSMDKEMVLHMLKSEFLWEAENLLFVKTKTEKILRANGKLTPYSNGTYTTLNTEVLDKETIDHVGAPLMTITIKPSGEEITNVAVIMEILNFYEKNPWYYFGGIHNIEREGEGYLIQLYAGIPGYPENYSVTTEIGTVIFHRMLQLQESGGYRYYYISYGPENSGHGFGTYRDYQEYRIGDVNYGSATLLYGAKFDNHGEVVPQMSHETVYYEVGDIPKDKSGLSIQAFQYVEKTKEIVQEHQMMEWVEIPIVKSERGMFGRITAVSSEETTYEFRIVVPEKEVELSASDIESMGVNSFEAGEVLSGALYYLYVKGAAVNVYFDGLTQSETLEISLLYEGDLIPVVMEQLSVLEEVITQQIKITKNFASNSNAVEGFVFQAYLKSNLDRLYKDEAGKILWVDEFGQDISILEEKEKFPQIVMQIHTKGDVKILEEGNYHKFFDAIAVANGDRWKEKNPTYSSYQPIQNERIRNEYQIENARVSDRVRQFAVDWYLEDEAKKFDGETALYHAIIKAREYLIPFFQYDLDRIYSIDWAEDEGFSNNKKMISADEKNQNSYSGISAPIPYGSYVVVEQQPSDSQGSDLENKHYRIDQPQILTVPQVYSNEVLDSYYFFDENQVEKIESKHKIRFQEENKVINARGNQGEFEIFPYGLSKQQSEIYEDKSSISETNTRRGIEGNLAIEYAHFAPAFVAHTVYPTLEDGKKEGYAHVSFLNKPYEVKVRIEKMDGSTKETIVHEAASFQIYYGEKDEKNGGIRFYEKDTWIQGSEAFLNGMGAKHIAEIEGESHYRGMVSADTPMCKEENLVTFHGNGIITTNYKGDFISDQPFDQVVGYGISEDYLEAGAYVLLEMHPPSGYVRTKPIGIELYSDCITYYQYGDRKKQIHALIYPWEESDIARIYVENIPIQLDIKKLEEKGTYLPGATLGLFESRTLEPTGDKEDKAYENLEIKRNRSKTSYTVL